VWSDEPTKALGRNIQKQVWSCLPGCQRKYGLSYILVTHDIDVRARHGAIASW